MNFDIVDDSNTTNNYPSVISDSNIIEVQNHVKIQDNLKKKTLCSHKLFSRKSVFV